MSIRDVRAVCSFRADPASRVPRMPILRGALVGRGSSRTVFALAALAALAMAYAPNGARRVAGAGRLAGIAGAGVSGIQITNLDPADAAAANARLSSQSGTPSVLIGPLAIAPLGAANIYLPTQSRLADGTYAALVSSDRPIGTIARTDWPTSGAAAMDDAAPAGTAVTAPLVARGFGGLSSIVTVQNVDTAAPATVGIAVRRLGESEAIVQTTVTVPAGTSRSLDLARDPLRRSARRLCRQPRGDIRDTDRPPRVRRLRGEPARHVRPPRRRSRRRGAPRAPRPRRRRLHHARRDDRGHPRHLDRRRQRVGRQRRRDRALRRPGRRLRRPRRDAR